MRKTALETSARLMKRATYAAVAVAALLIAAKIVAWLLTGSVSVLSSLLDSLLDIAASLLNLLAVRHAVTPADREHRFGHGKAEPLAGLGQSAFIAGSAAFLFIEVLHRALSPEPVENSVVGIAIMVFSIVITIGLVSYQRHVVARTGSLAISSDELHYRSDIILNGSVILSLVLASVFGWHFIDLLFGAAIGIWIVYSAWQVASRSLTQLMDREIPDEERARIRAIALAHNEVTAVHDLRTRAAGPTAFIQLHIEMDGTMPLNRAHVVADEVEARILEAFPNAEVIIHQDPAGVAEIRRTFPPTRQPA
ncbi:MAG TPA: cation diffusion facilitator family transporter [Stellaceae bacterium]|nr:cation diffusion facilitator family transporter [Stellaceae bacterium]